MIKVHIFLVDNFLVEIIKDLHLYRESLYKKFFYFMKIPPGGSQLQKPTHVVEGER